MLSEPQEKRRFPRIRLKTPLSFQIRGISGIHNAICDDISLGGAGFVNNEYLAPRTPVTAQINILSKILNPAAQVAWALPLPHSNRYRIGLEFLELEPQEKNYLKDYIDMQTGKIL
jgi:hypothetical protein